MVNGVQQSLSPCMNNGVCYNSADYQSYSCECATGFTGQYCEAELACNSIPCMNNSTCTDLSTVGAENFITETDFTCACSGAEWTGDLCETYLPCVLEPCQNAGACIDNLDTTYTCECAASFHGDTCENQSICESQEPCVSGDCTDSEDFESYTCQCLTGWENENCDAEIEYFSDLTNQLAIDGLSPATPLRADVIEFLQESGWEGDDCSNNGGLLLEAGGSFSTNSGEACTTTTDRNFYMAFTVTFPETSTNNPYMDYSLVRVGGRDTSTPSIEFYGDNYSMAIIKFTSDSGTGSRKKRSADFVYEWAAGFFAANLHQVNANTGWQAGETYEVAFYVSDGKMTLFSNGKMLHHEPVTINASFNEDVSVFFGSDGSSSEWTTNAEVENFFYYTF